MVVNCELHKFIAFSICLGFHRKSIYPWMGANQEAQGLLGEATRRGGGLAAITRMGHGTVQPCAKGDL